MSRVFSTLGSVIAGFVLVLMLVVGGVASTLSGTSGDSSGLATEMTSLGHENGLLPADVLEVVSSHGSSQCLVASLFGAAESWSLMVAVAALDGVDIEGGWCYRTYASQLDLWTSRQCFIAGMCDGDPYPPTATPGTSNHGWGLAIDIWGASDSVLTCPSSELGWLQVNAARFGWVHPGWAQCGSPGAEPWHWEYAGTQTTSRTIPGINP